MKMEKLTKEQIRLDYERTISQIGSGLYRFCLPALELLEQLRRVMILNNEMAVILEEERKAQKKMDEKLKVAVQEIKPDEPKPAA